MITHDHEIAGRLRRQVQMLDGQIVSDSKPDSSHRPDAETPSHSDARRDARPADNNGGNTMSATALIPARLGAGDLARVASVGLRTRRLRAALSALGIAIGVAAIVAVLGLSSSSQAGLLGGDRPARHQPADRHQRPEPHRPDRRAPAPCTGDDRPHRSRRAGAVHRRDDGKRLPQPADPHNPNKRADRRRRQPRACRARSATPCTKAAT